MIDWLRVLGGNCEEEEISERHMMIVLFDRVV